MKMYFYLKRVSVIVFLVFIMLLTYSTTHAYWASSISVLNIDETSNITVGDWLSSMPPQFDETIDYQVDDEFVYNGAIWVVIADWFDPSQFLNPDGTINYQYLRPYGPIREDTIEWRIYNTYNPGDTVLHNGYYWIVRHFGANGVEPGSNTEAWNRISDEWFMYNTYLTGDIVLYNGQYWRSLSYSRNIIPGQASWAWELVL